MIRKSTLKSLYLFPCLNCGYLIFIAVEQTPSSTSNEELFLNYCRSYGIENVNLNQPESNKYLLKMLLNPQTTSSMYSSLFSTLFSSLNNTNGDFLIANNTIEQPKLILDNDDEKNMNSSRKTKYEKLKKFLIF
jgi:hypothetical protein